MRQYDVPFSALEWDPSCPPLASGTFSDVYYARWNTSDGKQREVAIKVHRDVLDEANVTDVLMEEDNLR